jgi:hypothetical protein
VITTDTVTFCWRLGGGATLPDLYRFARALRDALDERGGAIGLVTHDVRVADDATHEHVTWTAATSPRAALDALSKLKSEVIAATRGK